jgi:hypothetical protein
VCALFPCRGNSRTQGKQAVTWPEPTPYLQEAGACGATSLSWVFWECCSSSTLYFCFINHYDCMILLHSATNEHIRNVPKVTQLEHNRVSLLIQDPIPDRRPWPTGQVGVLILGMCWGHLERILLPRCWDLSFYLHHHQEVWFHLDLGGAQAHGLWKCIQTVLLHRTVSLRLWFKFTA